MDLIDLTDIRLENSSQYKKIMILAFVVSIFITLFYFVSETYRVNLVLNSMGAYNSVLTIKNTQFKKKMDTRFRTTK